MSNGARKFDSGKAPITTGLLWRFPRAVKEVARVSAVGAEKYEVTLPDDNCLRVENGFNRYADAIARHLVDRAIDGPMNNEKGGALPPEGRDVRHLAQLIWDGLTCLEIELIEEEKTNQKDSTSLPLHLTGFPEDYQMGELPNEKGWWTNWQDARYPSPAAGEPTHGHRSPSPRSHSHTSSGQGDSLSKPYLKLSEAEPKVQKGNAGKSGAR